MKARGSTVDLIISDENPGNVEVPLEIESHTCQFLVGDGMNNKLCPPFSFPWINEVPNGPILLISMVGFLVCQGQRWVHTSYIHNFVMA